MTTIIKNVRVMLTPALDIKIDGIVAHLERIAAAAHSDSVVCEFQVEREARHRKGDISRAEIHFTYEGHRFHASARGMSELDALDRANDELTRVLTASKDRQRSRVRRAGARRKRGGLAR